MNFLMDRQREKEYLRDMQNQQYHVPMAMQHLNKADIYFVDMVTEILYSKEGVSTEGTAVRGKYKDGTPAHTRLVNNLTFNYDLSKGEFPIITLRPQAWKNAIKEMLWIYQDQSNSLDLLKEKYGITWWDSWDIGDRTIGQRYGATVKKYDLMNKVIHELRTNKSNRRIIMNMFQYSDLEDAKGLYPCAFETIWNARGEYLDMMMVQRSSDVCVAWSINQLQYAALMMMVAAATGLKPGKFTHVIANAHVYDRHVADLIEMVNDNVFGRMHNPTYAPALKPMLVLKPKSDDFYSFTIDDFEMVDYAPNPKQRVFELAI